MSHHCEAIVAEFFYGPKRCGADATATAIDQTWGTTHHVCPEHTPKES